MIETDSLDHITLDSDDIQTIERFKNNYYNHKKNVSQNGGNNTQQSWQVAVVALAQEVRDGELPKLTQVGC